jgi:hypothetical protein
MTKEQAIQLAAQIERDYAGRLKATPEDYRKSSRLRLLLIPGQRTTLVYHYREWQSIKQAWQWFLLPEEAIVVQPREQPKPRHLVDGIPMYIFLRQDRYWIGTYTTNKQAHKKYFGKVDPRPRYPLYEEAVS